MEEAATDKHLSSALVVKNFRFKQKRLLLDVMKLLKKKQIGVYFKETSMGITIICI